MDQQTQLEATRTIWIVVGIIIFALIVSATFMEILTAGHVILGIAVAIAGLGSTRFVWEVTEAKHDTEKSKRQAIDDVLRDMSDDDLERLKQRLADGTINDDLLYEQMTLGDDGELVNYSGRNTP